MFNLQPPLNKTVDGVNTSTGTGNVSIIPAQGIGTHIYVTSIILDNADAAVNTHVQILDGTTVRLTVAVPKDNGKEVLFPRPLKLGENSPLQVKALAAVTTLSAYASGFKE